MRRGQWVAKPFAGTSASAPPRPAPRSGDAPRRSRSGAGPPQGRAQGLGQRGGRACSHRGRVGVWGRDREARTGRGGRRAERVRVGPLCFQAVGARGAGLVGGVRVGAAPGVRAWVAGAVPASGTCGAGDLSEGRVRGPG